ncbi:luciferase [Prauserella flavalba]|uniref:Luciferase n=1 Tax=Prauserella flavalba TaxID=1477506 RepID=A0A318L9F0_9PSEU|nr:luciferase [Prauserella flavalba]
MLGGDLATVTDLTARAEAAGFNSVWTTEFYERSAIVSLATMATATTRVTLGSAIAYAVGRSPLVLATEARDLDELSGGRLVLGLGTGTRTMQRDWHGADPDAPALRMEELVPLLRRFWAMDERGIDHDGRFYSVHLRPTADIRPPLRPDIPVHLAGVNRRMIRAAGAVADGLVGHPVFSRKYVDAVVRPALEDGAERAGRPSGQVTLSGYLICSVHDDVSIARQEAKAQIAFYAMVRTYAAAFELLGFGAAIAEIRAAWQRRDRAAMIAAVPDDLVDLLAVAGPPDEVRQRFATNFADVYDHTMLYSPSFGLSEERFAENVLATIETFAG